MRLNKFVALGPGLALIAGVAAPAGAHSLKSVEDQLRQDERYLQLMNQPAPEFTLEDAYGNQVSLDDFEGKVVVLNFVYARLCVFYPCKPHGVVRNEGAWIFQPGV